MRPKRKASRQKRSEKPVYFVMCEGMTEEQYIDFIVSSLPEKRLSINAEQPGSNQRTLFRAAKNRLLECSNEERVWILCDVDEGGEYLKEVGAATPLASEVKWAVSNPAIAAWFLMHDGTPTRHEHRDVFAAMAKDAGLLTGRRAKVLVEQALRSKSGTAVDSAEKLRNAHLTADCTFPKDNPSSTVDLLLQAIVDDYNSHPLNPSDPGPTLTVRDLY